MERTEPVRVIEGRIAAVDGDDGLAMARVTLMAGGVASATAAKHNGFWLRTEDGSELRVEADATAELEPPQRLEAGRWRDVGRTPLGVLFARSAPGPHVAVELVGTAVRRGDAVRVEGHRVAPKATKGGYRDLGADVLRVHRVTLQGVEPLSTATPATPQTSREATVRAPWTMSALHWLAYLVGAPPLVAGLVAWDGLLAYAAASFGALLVATGGYRWGRLNRPPIFRRGAQPDLEVVPSKHRGLRRVRLPWHGRYVGWFAWAGALPWVVAGTARGEPWVWAVGAGITIGALAAASLILDREGWHRLGALGAPPARPGDAGRWAAIDGTATTDARTLTLSSWIQVDTKSTGHGAETVRVYRTVEVEYRESSFEVGLPDGSPLRLEGSAGASWATSVRRVVLERPPAAPARTRIEEAIKAGDPVRVVGTVEWPLEAPPTVRLRGTESLLILGGRPGRSAAAELRRARWRSALAPLLMGVLALLLPLRALMASLGSS